MCTMIIPQKTCMTIVLFLYEEKQNCSLDVHFVNTSYQVCHRYACGEIRKIIPELSPNTLPLTSPLGETIIILHVSSLYLKVSTDKRNGTKRFRYISANPVSRWRHNYIRLNVRKSNFDHAGPSEDSDQPVHSRSLIRKFTGAFWTAKDAKVFRKWGCAG